MNKVDSSIGVQKCLIYKREFRYRTDRYNKEDGYSSETEIQTRLKESVFRALKIRYFLETVQKK